MMQLVTSVEGQRCPKLAELKWSFELELVFKYKVSALQMASNAHILNIHCATLVF